jgi:hypothetical protein
LAPPRTASSSLQLPSLVAWSWPGGGGEGERQRGRGGQGEGKQGDNAGVCSGREPAGNGGKWSGWWGNWRDMGKIGGKMLVSLARGARASDRCCREVPVLLVGSCSIGAGTGASAHLLGSPPHRHDFGAAGAGRLLAPNPNSTPAVFWEAFWGRWWRCSYMTVYGHMP